MDKFHYNNVEMLLILWLSKFPGHCQEKVAVRRLKTLGSMRGLRYLFMKPCFFHVQSNWFFQFSGLIRAIKNEVWGSLFCVCNVFCFASVMLLQAGT